MSQVLLARSGLAPSLLRLLITLLTGFALLSGAYAFTQSAGDRWVMLATRALDTKTGRASIDLRRAKGAFKAVRLTVKTGALTLTRVELTYGDGTVLKVRRSLTLREEQKSPLIGRRAHDAFIDNIALTFKGAAGELDTCRDRGGGPTKPAGASGRPQFAARTTALRLDHTRQQDGVSIPRWRSDRSAPPGRGDTQKSSSRARTGAQDGSRAAQTGTRCQRHRRALGCRACLLRHGSWPTAARGEYRLRDRARAQAGTRDEPS